MYSLNRIVIKIFLQLALADSLLLVALAFFLVVPRGVVPQVVV